MTRNVNPVPQFFDDAGAPLVAGKMYYFESGTDTPKPTFADINLTIANPHPVLLGGSGRLPNVFFTGSARQKLTDSDNIQFFDKDPVGAENIGADFEPWVPQIIYNVNDIVEGSDGNFYKSFVNGNTDNDPISSPAFWEQVEFVSVWNTNVSYVVGNTVKASDNNFWKSLVAPNLGNDPISSPTEWGTPIVLDLSAPPPVGDDTPNTGDFTDLTGANINGPVGDDTPNTGDFTDLTGTNINGPIGNDAPNTGKFTDVETPTINSHGMWGNRNFLRNGAFPVAQQGTAFTSATVPANNDDTYLLDDCILLSDGNDIVDVNQLTDAGLGNYAYLEADVETIQKKFGFLKIVQQKDLVYLLGANKTVSLSFKAKVSDITKLDNIKAVVLSWDGTADAVTSDVVSVWGAEDITPTWVANWTEENEPANLTVTAAEATYKIENISIDTAGVGNVAVFIWSDAVADNDTLGTKLHITDIQLEPGPKSSDFDYRPFDDELARCKWRFERINVADAANQIIGPSFNNATAQAHAFIEYSEKASDPAISSTAFGTFAVRHAGTATPCDSSITFEQGGVKGTKMTLNFSATPLTAGQGSQLARDGTDTCHIDIDARL